MKIKTMLFVITLCLFWFLASWCHSFSQYDPRFGDAFWNSSKYGMVNYLLRMMSSWAIVCSVWYLPPMSREVRPHARFSQCIQVSTWVCLNSVEPNGCHFFFNVERLRQQEGEDAVQFANRVKSAIARQGGLVDLLWYVIQFEGFYRRRWH